MAATHSSYYVPSQSHWPIIGSIGLFTTVIGAATWIHGHPAAKIIFFIGALIVAYMMYGWFSNVIQESLSGKFNKQVDRSFRLGMLWFIFSEVMFFVAFFGALFYIREFSVPWLGGEGAKGISGEVLWHQFKATWPLLVNPNNKDFVGPEGVIHAFGIPAFNTLLLLSSGITITIAHWGLKKNNKTILVAFLGLTILLGITFLGFQIHEYMLAHYELGLTLGSGVYGSTFFMLTGFHGAHVTVGTIMLLVMFVRSIKDHFTPEHHFAFEAAAWYWHFVDVVWVILFIFVYWI